MKEINLKSNNHDIKLERNLKQFCSRFFNFKLSVASCIDTVIKAIFDKLYECGFESSHRFAPEEEKLSTGQYVYCCY
jgi:hypothetical protein